MVDESKVKVVSKRWVSGWWFWHMIFLFFPYIGNNNPNWFNWRKLFRGVGQPPIRYSVTLSFYPSLALMVNQGWLQSSIVQMGLSENRVYSQWNSHLIGIMISKTIGFRGTLFSDKPRWVAEPPKVWKTVAMTRARCRRKPFVLVVGAAETAPPRALWDIERQSPSEKRWVWSKQKFISDITAVFIDVPPCFEGNLMTPGSLAGDGTRTESRGISNGPKEIVVQRENKNWTETLESLE